jgi:hypothetical protein
MSGAGTWVTFATGSGADFAVHSYPSGGKEPCQRQRASHGSRSPWSWRAVMIARTRSRPTDGPSLRLTSESAPLADVRGTWLWTEEALFSVAAPLTSVFFGIQPEGPITHFTCHESGTMTLTQSGSSFSGTATQDSECRTRGGQVFSPRSSYRSSTSPRARSRAAAPHHQLGGGAAVTGGRSHPLPTIFHSAGAPPANTSGRCDVQA